MFCLTFLFIILFCEIISASIPLPKIPSFFCRLPGEHLGPCTENYFYGFCNTISVSEPIYPIIGGSCCVCERGYYRDPVRFKCVPIENCPSTAERTVCENKVLTIICPPFTKIVISNATYGRHDTEVCSKTGLDSNTKCTSNVTKILQQRCNVDHPLFKSKFSFCNLNVSNEIFGDPCVGTYKYLQVNYTCNPVQIPKVATQSVLKYLCDDEIFNITCPSFYPIHINYAKYGRQNFEICPKDGVNLNKKCSVDVTDIIREGCNEDRGYNCSFKVSNQIFGGHCSRTSNYLEISYTCKQMNSFPFRNCSGQNEEFRCLNCTFQEYCNAPVFPYYQNTPSCEKRCVCKEGYLRAPFKSICVKREYCPLPGQNTHEEYSECGAACQRTCTNRTSVCSFPCVHGYVCTGNYIRDTKTKKCVLPEQCSVSK